MTPVIVSVGSFLAAELERMTPRPEWRKATRNMIMGTLSIDRALADLQIDRADCALVLGSMSGELETSSEFLTSWSRQKLARPILFQNSLHNATTGFASIHFGFTGPTLSVSSFENTPRESLALGMAMLESCRFSVVTLVEGHRHMAKLIDVQVTEGAVTAVLCAEETAREMSLPILRECRDFEWAGSYPVERQGIPLVDITSSPFFGELRRLESV